MHAHGRGAHKNKNALGGGLNALASVGRPGTAVFSTVYFPTCTVDPSLFILPEAACASELVSCTRIHSKHGLKYQQIMQLYIREYNRTAFIDR